MVGVAFIPLLLLAVANAKSPQQTERKLLRQDFRNVTVWQALREMARSSSPEFIGMASIFQSNCTSDLLNFLDDPEQTMTLFAPSDNAFLNFFHPRRIPLRYIGCGEESCSGTIASYQLNSIDPYMLRNCLREIALYHIVPGFQFVSLQNLGNVPSVVTVLPTMLNSTSGVAFANLAEDTPQSVIVNQTSTRLTVNRWVNHGVLQPATIIYRNITCLNGIIQGIDRILLPPVDLFSSLQQLQPSGTSSVINALRTPQLVEPVKRLSNITVFFPVTGFQLNRTEEAVLRSLSSLYNYTDYLVEGRVIYNNQTRGSLNVTTVGLTQRNVTFGQNYTMAIDGIRVVNSNILLNNGILHLIEQPFPSQNKTKIDTE